MMPVCQPGIGGRFVDAVQPLSGTSFGPLVQAFIESNRLSTTDRITVPTPAASPTTATRSPAAHAYATGPVRVGVFDSGVGGLSVLRTLRQQLPEVHLIYVADSAYAPYGERSDAEIIDRTERISAFLRQQGAQVLVIACNTATAAAVEHLRRAHPDWPIVGVEPGLKPATQLTRNGRIGVMATSGTLRSEKFQRLMAQHGSDVFVHLQACPGLAHAIEQGDLQSPQLLSLINQYSLTLREHAVDTVVLGCTHYPFVREPLQAALGPGVSIIDTAEPVARRTAQLIASLRQTQQSTDQAPGPNTSELWTSGNVDALRHIAQRWLDFDFSVRALPDAH